VVFSVQSCGLLLVRLMLYCYTQAHDGTDGICNSKITQNKHHKIRQMPNIHFNIKKLNINLKLDV